MPNERTQRPPQHQDRQPGIESKMEPRPEFRGEEYRPGGKLTDKVALITGGDSGIGRAVAVHFAKEGADVAIVYFDEDDDAKLTAKAVEGEGRRALLVAGDIGDPEFCDGAVQRAIEEFGRLDVVLMMHEPFFR
ncbi:MAG TPA: SDR family NAD(P)-dependent oxidoreductase [Trueperaceae bacterium]|nr:SDR family NAD(P)-dependent oxidoreductase [Trueperaceae bacterium]